jgi:hypothetical protein
MPGSTPIYGFPYPDPSDLVANYPALGQQLAEDIEDVLPTIGGLVTATPTTIANSGGSSSLTANTVGFSGVNSISLNGCFTTAYDNYRIIIRYIGSTGLDIALRLRVGGADASGASDYTRQNFFAFSTTVGADTSAGSSHNVGTANTTNGVSAIELLGPANAVATFFNVNAGRSDSIRTLTGFHNQATAYDGFTIIPNTGTITGSITVYGYRK